MNLKMQWITKYQVNGNKTYYVYLLMFYLYFCILTIR
jgi:hypothetical protein